MVSTLVVIVALELVATPQAFGGTPILKRTVVQRICYLRKDEVCLTVGLSGGNHENWTQIVRS